MPFEAMHFAVVYVPVKNDMKTDPHFDDAPQQRVNSDEIAAVDSTAVSNGGFTAINTRDRRQLRATDP